jgi:hypothetical protein
MPGVEASVPGALPGIDGASPVHSPQSLGHDAQVSEEEHTPSPQRCPMASPVLS